VHPAADQAAAGAFGPVGNAHPNQAIERALARFEQLVVEHPHIALTGVRVDVRRGLPLLEAQASLGQRLLEVDAFHANQAQAAPPAPPAVPAVPVRV
jgi:hypothetical protein